MILSALLNALREIGPEKTRRKPVRSASTSIELVEIRCLLSSITTIPGRVPVTPGGGSPSGEVNPLTSIPVLNSLVGAPVNIYLDFDGHTESQDWPSSRTTGTGPVVTPVYDLDNDLTTFSDEELRTIEEIWYRMSEDYAPFNVNVTTVNPGTFLDFENVLVSFGGDGAWIGSPGGVAYLDAFNSPVVNTCYVFTDNTGKGNIDHAKGSALAGSHEVGHQLGLLHHAVYDANGTQTAAYDSGRPDLGPIMGAPYTSLRETWANAPDSNGVNSIQDDLAVITRAANRTFQFRVDDFGSSVQTALRVIDTNGALSTKGVIEQNSDMDFFEFETDTGSISFDAQGLNLSSVYAINNLNFGTNLDIELRLYDSAGNVIATAAPTPSLFASLSANVTQGIYYIGVSGTGQYGALGGYSLTGTVIPLPSVPTMMSPSGTSAELRPTFSWTVGANAVSYELEVDNLTKPINGYYTANVTTTSEVSTKTFEQGDYRARVRTVSLNGTKSAWSTYLQFKIDVPTPSIPTIIRPKGITGDSFPVFEWTAAANAASIDLLVNRVDDNFRVIYRTNYSGTSYQHFNALRDAAYRVIIRSRNSVGETSAWSEATLFSVKAPLPTASKIIAPVGTITSVKPRFTWTAVNGAAFYELRVHSLSLGITDYIKESRLPRTQTFYNAPYMAQGNYVAYVRAVNGNGVLGPWSPARSFTLNLLPPGAPSVTGPRGVDDSPTIQTTNPTFTWTVPVRGTRYDLLVNNLTTQTAGVIRVNGLRSTTFTAQSDLPQGRYRVWVRAYNAASEVGDWSAPFDFNIDEPTPSIPTITAPVVNSLGYVENANPAFMWTSTTPPAAAYDLQLYNVTLGKFAFTVSDITSPNYTVPTEKRLGEFTYRARVRAKNISGDTTNWSAPYIFRINIPDPTTPVIVGPGDTITDTTPTFSWRHTSTSFTYEILVRDLLRNEDISHQVKSFSLDPGGATASYTLPAANALKPGTYRFWVRAFNSLGQASGWSTSMTFVITAQLEESLQKPPAENLDELAKSPIVLALSDKKFIPAEVRRKVTPQEEAMTEESVVMADQSSDVQRMAVPEVHEDESLIDAFMHRISDPSSEADFTFLRS